MFSNKEITNNFHRIYRLLSVLMSFVVVLSVMSCNSANSEIIGEWRSTGTDEPAHSITFDREGEAVLQDSEGRALTVFEYDIDGDKLTLTTNGAETTWTFIVESDSLIIDAGGTMSKYNKTM